jgi:hypothetical protein
MSCERCGVRDENCGYSIKWCNKNYEWLCDRCKKMSTAENPWTSLHVSRSWAGAGHPLENQCPCPQEKCGYVSLAKADPKCAHHGMGLEKTIRDSHYEKDCPGVGK